MKRFKCDADDLSFNVEIDREYNQAEDQVLPERRLLVAILERSLLDLKHSDRKIRESAIEWCAESEEENPGFTSLQYICMSLDLDFLIMKEKIFNLIITNAAEMATTVQ